MQKRDLATNDPVEPVLYSFFSNITTMTNIVARRSNERTCEANNERQNQQYI